MKNSWFFYFLKKAIRQRFSRFIISAAAVMLTVSVVTALMTLSLGIREKMGQVLRQYGANMIVTDASGGIIDMETARAVADVSDAVRDRSFQLYGTVSVEDRQIEIIGMEMEKLSGYRIDGAVPRGDDEVLAGVGLRDVLKIPKGNEFSFEEPRRVRMRLSGYFEKGADEDSMLIMPLDGLQGVMGVEGVSAVLLNVDSRFLEDVERAVVTAFPALQVRTLRQVAVAERKVLAKIQLLMIIVTAVVLFSSVIALGSTMGANVLERMEEIGLMKAIGATPGDIRKFFMAEAALAGLSGALCGYGMGILIAELVSRTAFHSWVPVSFIVVFLAITLGMSIAVLSTMLPVRDAMNVIPARILRGE